MPQTIFFNATWSPDGQSIVFSVGDPSGLYEVPASGGTAKVLLRPGTIKPPPDETSLHRGQLSAYIYNPHFLPAKAGPRVLAFAFGYIASTLMIQDLDTGRREILGRGQKPFYSPSGHLLYWSGWTGSELWAQPLSLDRLRVTGEAFLVARSATDATVAADGTLVYVDAIPEQLVWLNRQGARSGTVGQPAQGVFYPALSPDGRFVAVETLENANLDVWVYDIARGARIRLTDDPATDILPVWSPSGEEVAFSSYRAGNIDIYLRRADAGAEEKALVATARNERVSDWSPDGRYILYSLLDPKNGYDLWYLKRNEKGEWEPHPFLQTSFNERAPKLSPDGRYVAYLSDESGRDEAYIRPFPEGGRKWPVSANGASQIRWGRNGRELFYAEARTLLAVPVRTAPEFVAGPATRLFSHAALTYQTEPNYDVSADGQRILLPERVGGQERMIRVVQNWFAEFRDRQH
ncbi:MAG: PD40 domain-containing protein [Acidobacteria bacterium]|nr:PD40 domain-containing protein [Acidobacteriota bacterium]